MTYLEITDVNKVYDNVNSLKQADLLVNHKEFKKFYFELKTLERDVATFSNDGLWPNIIRKFKKVRFDFCAAPLPFSTSAIISQKDIQELKCYLSRLQISYPQYVKNVSCLIDKIITLKSLSENPLLEQIVMRVTETGAAGAAILLKDARWILETETVVRNNWALKETSIISQYELQGSNFYESIFVIGPRYWFPQYIFTSPRAKSIIDVRYSWLFGHTQETPSFISQVCQRKIDVPIKLPDVKDGKTSMENILELEESRTPIEWNLISQRIDKGQNIGEAVVEEVAARLYLLEGRMAVFLESEESAKTLVIDLEGDEDERGELQRVKRVPASTIEPGMYILLRTAGGGDYIIPLAEKLLGKESELIKHSQLKWKSLLRDYAKKKGLFQTAIDLLDMGSVRANEFNVRNWMSGSNIKPDDHKDFSAIMELIGLKHEVEDYWQKAEKLDSAHRKAGSAIRRYLLKQVLTLDLTGLKKNGRMDFTFAEADSASITAFRVIAVSPSTYKIPWYKHAHPFDIQD